MLNTRSNRNGLDRNRNIISHYFRSCMHFFHWLKLFGLQVLLFQREFLIELHRNLICKFCIIFDRKNSINFWIELHTTFQRTKSRLNLIGISSIKFNQIFPAGIYNILCDIKTFYNFVGLCRNFEDSGGVVSWKCAQLDITRFYAKLRTYDKL